MTEPAALYLDLMKRVLSRSAFVDQEVRDIRLHFLPRYQPLRYIGPLLRRNNARLVVHVDQGQRGTGRDWPPTAETMIGMQRLDNLQYCVETALADNVAGDLIETGVWRGGAAIFMRAVLAAHGVTDRTVWAADTFAGLPAPNTEKYPDDAGLDFTSVALLAVGVDAVKANFRRYNLLDDQVQFLVGLFADTLPTAPIERLAVLRLDGDLYESTIDALSALYPKLSPGGFCIIDDYGNIPACAKAVHDYRDAHGITEPVVDVDGYGVFWRRTQR